MSTYPFVFRRFAGSLQMRIRTFDDLLAVRDLPEVHWVALACPTDGLNCDPRFLGYLDIDNNRRVRVREVLDAIDWLAGMLDGRGGCVPGTDTLELSCLSAGAATLRRTADLVLDNLQAADRTRITLQQVRQTEQILGRGASNGDGIITVGGVEDPALRAVVEDILRHLPGAKDLGGEVGVDQKVIKAFRAARAKALDWIERKSASLAWGEQSIEHALLLRAVAPRLDEYFLQCRLVATQPEIAGQLRFDATRIADMLGDLDRLKHTLAALPIAPADPSGVLDWRARYRGEAWELLERFRREVCVPVLGDGAGERLAEDQWLRLKREAAPILAWHDQTTEHPLLALGADRLRAIDERYLDALEQLSANDLKLGEILAKVNDLEKLVLYQRWLFDFVNNFVSMPNLYHTEDLALFEQGMLLMAGREFNLAVLVPNRAQHAAFSSESSMYTMYLEVTGGKPERKFEIAVPVTAGTSTGLFVGKRGVFRAIDGQEYDAVVVQIIVQPVSLYEAITQPFTRIGKFFTTRIEKWSSSMDKDFEKNVELTALAPPIPVPGATSPTPATPPAPPPPRPPGAPAAPAAPANAAGLLMGGSVAFAAIGSGLAYVVKQVSTTPIMNLVYGLVIVCALLALPTTILAWLKLRRRNLAIVLEASGWALNDRLRLTRTLGKLFTRRRSRPPGSRTELTDEVGKLLLLRKAKHEDADERRGLGWWVFGAGGVAVASAVFAWWLLWGPSPYAQTRRCEKFIERLAPSLANDRFSGVTVSYPKPGGDLWVQGTVPDANDETTLKTLIDTAKPPAPLRWEVRVGAAPTVPALDASATAPPAAAPIVPAVAPAP